MAVEEGAPFSNNIKKYLMISSPRRIGEIGLCRRCAAGSASLTDELPALALAVGTRPEEDLMRRPPRNRRTASSLARRTMVIGGLWSMWNLLLFHWSLFMAGVLPSHGDGFLCSW